MKIEKRGKETIYHFPIPEKDVKRMMDDVEKVVNKHRYSMGFKTELNVAEYALALRNMKPKTLDRAVIKFIKKKKLKKVM